MTAKPATIVPLTRQGADTPDDVKEDAFRLWIELGRSWRLVSRQTGIPERTLYTWGREGQWQERRQQEAQAFLPGAFAESAIALRLAAHNAAVRLQQIAYEAKELGIKPDRNEVQALSLIVDRGGFSPTGKSETIHHASTPANDQPTISTNGKSVSELMAIESSYRQVKR